MEMWAKVGIKGKLDVTDKSTGNDAEMMSRSSSNPIYFADPFGSFDVMWAPDGPSEGAGRFNTHAEYAEMWERFHFSTDTETCKGAYVELMGRIRQDPPVLPLYRPFESWAMQKGINWVPQPGHIPYVLDFRARSVSPADG